jgi:hypothetical protein
MDMAAGWYEARRQDLGIDFVTAVREALQRVAEAPQTWPLVRGASGCFGYLFRLRIQSSDTTADAPSHEFADALLPSATYRFLKSGWTASQR